MSWYNREYNDYEIDWAEKYRQDYMDALDEIRNLKYKIYELEIENNLLEKDIARAERHIGYYKR